MAAILQTTESNAFCWMKWLYFYQIFTEVCSPKGVIDNKSSLVHIRVLPQIGKKPEGCFTNLSQAHQNNLTKLYNARNHFYGENFKLKLCMCAQSIALDTHTKLQLEILTRSMISVIHKFQEIILENSWNISETISNTWTNADQASWCRMLSLGHNELICWVIWI